jgi:hypothetical protein
MMISMDDVGGLSGFVDFLEKMEEKVNEYNGYVAEEKLFGDVSSNEHILLANLSSR